MTLIFAHRGASRAARENTVEAFETAVEMGADGVELDVRRTLDDRLVVHHDAALADGRIIRQTAAADLPEHIPDFDAALAACGPLIVNVEIKNSEREPDFDPTEWVAYRVAAELAARPPAGRWLLSSFRFETVATFARLLPAAKSAWLTTSCTAAEIDRASAAGHHAIHPRVAEVDRRSIAAAHAAGLAVNVWTCDDPDRMADLIAWGVDGICTNVPDIALQIRAGR